MWHEAAEEEGWETEKINRLSSDLYYILVEKTDDEVATRVSEGESNDGIPKGLPLDGRHQRTGTE